MALCLSVCMSQVGVLSKRLNESSWFLAWELSSTYSAQRYKEIRVPSKIKVLPSGTLLQTLDLRKFCHGISIGKTRYQLSSTKVHGRPERDKLDRRRSTKLTILPTLDR